MGSTVSRRRLLKQGAAVAIGGGAAALVGGGPALAQAGNGAGAAAAGRKIKAWVSRGFGANTTHLEELTLLPISGRQVIVRTEVTQCCYTMAARMLGTQDPPDPLGPQAAPVVNDPNLPTIQGHGGVGVVEAVGPGVTRVQVGDRVIVAVTPQCGVCYNCLRGRADRCQYGVAAKAIPIARGADGKDVVQAGNIGGMADVMVAEEQHMVPVFTSAPSDELAMLHCVGGCGLGMAMTLSPVEPGSNVAIWGGGPVGLSAVQGARIMGASTIILVEPVRARRELGLKVGATHALDPGAEGANLVPKIKDLCKGNTRVLGGGRNDVRNRAQLAAAVGPDFVMEAVGYDRAVPKVEAGPDPTGIQPLQQMWQATPTSGHICTCGVGFPPQATIALPVNQWTNSGRTHHSSQYGGVNAMRDLPRYVRLIERGLYDAKSLITTRYPLDKAMDAYRDVADRTTVTAMIMVGAGARS
jgi:S-(hydroxymethyl)glutathione dehydrogenase / alcohol dehydrogenase